MIRYEWLVEEVDSFDDIIDTAAWSSAHEMVAAMKAELPTGQHYDFGLVRDNLRDDGELVDRQWAYIKGGKLPDEFDGGAQVPMRFFKEWNSVN